jgi:hypothetical protein
MHRLGILFLFVVTLSRPLMAQAPTGTIAGTVTDQSGEVLPKATVTVSNKETGATRVVQSGPEGAFSIPSLPPGFYDVLIEAPGFQPTIAPVEVVTGSTATVRLGLQVSTRMEAITVIGASTTVDLSSNRVQGVVGRQQIENLPLNGRSFLNLAQLQPGVTVALGNPAQFNAQFNVSVLGGPASRTAITVDGGNIRNPVEGGTGQNFSQEVVQEFQISTANFDLSTGIAAFGAINVVTRSGSNAYRGAGYFYHRDENIAAYPSLSRSPLTDKPEFSRRQEGFVLGGPIKKDKVHFFGSYERTDQHGVYIVQPDLPSVAGFSTLAPAPYVGNQLSGRVDYRINSKHSLFARYSYDGNTNSGPFGIPVPPSNFVSNKNHVDQQLLGITSILSGSLVNDFRFSHMYWRNRNSPAACAGDVSGNCIGSGGPEIFYLSSVNFALGNNFNSPQGRDLHRFPISNNTTWQKGSHQVKFGGSFEHVDAVGYWGFFDPARVYLLSPEYLRGVGVPPALLGIPDQIRSQADLMRLPVVTFILGIGDRAQPSYNLENARGNDRYHLYIQDGWKVTPNFTLNYGLGWEHETNVLNYDLSKPAYLAPIYGSDLSPTKKQYKNFAPAAGFAWSIGKEHATVIRGGAGIFYDTQLGWWRLGERAVIGGSGRQFIFNSAVTNPVTGQPFSDASLAGLGYNYGAFLAQLPALRAQQEAKYPGTGTQPQILLSKQATALGALYPRDFPTTRANHFNAGFQREMGDNMIVQADVVYRKMLHGTPGGFFGASVDYNKFRSLAGPVIPRCATTALANDPNAQCSSGAINFWWPGATAEYKALLLKVDKRFSNKYMFTASYALQSSHSILDVTQNLDDFFATYGPDQPRHQVGLSAMVELPWKVQLSALSSFQSRPPVAPTIAGVDNTGTNAIGGSPYTPLLGVLGKGYAAFLSTNDLAALVDEYNSTIAGTLTPAGRAGTSANQRYPRITLPADYQLQDVFSSQDVRVTKTFRMRDRVDLRIIGEVFNILNISNLTNFNFNLVVPATFGKANQRVGQTFGSGGPRAFQLAARVSF